jgi:hypothetical protein
MVLASISVSSVSTVSEGVGVLLPFPPHELHTIPKAIAIAAAYQNLFIYSMFYGQMSDKSTKKKAFGKKKDVFVPIKKARPKPCF